MKGLYHQQVLGFIAKNCGSRLSKEQVEICVSYLVYKYIWSSTKDIILTDLTRRADDKDEVQVMLEEGMVTVLVGLLSSHDREVQATVMWTLAGISKQLDGAQAIVDAHALDLVPQLLDSPNAWVLQWTCNMLDILFGMNHSLGRYWMHHNTSVQDEAIYALANISQKLDGAQAVVDAHALDLVPQLLDSPAEKVLQWTCNMLGQIGAILDVKPCVRLISLALHHNILVQTFAIYALTCISRQLDGACAVVDAHALDLVPQLLDSPAEEVLRWTCDMLGQIAWHKTLTRAILDVKPWVQLVFLALHHNTSVQDDIRKTVLWKFGRWLLDSGDLG
ncbi:armadillo-type protein [Mycena sp. CBHHK59/15]|nr:armadillo-type protein [Mycena sp. CBHHK59/15]